jgi:transposase
MLEVETVDAVSTIELLEAIEALHPTLALIHLFLDNARYHHAKLVRDWLARPECRIKLHFIPPYCPQLNPIERLWASCTRISPTTVVTRPSRNSRTPRSVSYAEKSPRPGEASVIRNFHVPKDFQVLA